MEPPARLDRVAPAGRKALLEMMGPLARQALWAPPERRAQEPSARLGLVAPAVRRERPVMMGPLARRALQARPEQRAWEPSARLDRVAHKATRAVSARPGQRDQPEPRASARLGQRDQPGPRASAQLDRAAPAGRKERLAATGPLVRQVPQDQRGQRALVILPPPQRPTRLELEALVLQLNLAWHTCQGTECGFLM